MRYHLCFIVIALWAATARGAETFPAFVTGQPSASALTGTELFPLIQSGGTVTLTPNTFKTWLNLAPTWGVITGSLSNQTDLAAALAAKVPTITTVNGHALSSNITLSASDILTGTLPLAQLPAIPETQVTGLTTDLSNRALTTTTINGHALNANVLLSASDLTTGTLPAAQLPATVVQTSGSYSNPTWLTGLVPTSTTVNGHALSSNVTVTANDVLPSQSGNSGKYLTTNGANASWATVSGGLSNITDTLSTASPNSSVNVEALTVTGGGTNTALALAPKGTGYLALSLPDGTATGGNARGANAVDLQMSRITASQVAGSSQSSIAGGKNNSIDTASTAASIGGGGSNVISTGSYAHVGGGGNNTAGGWYAAVGGGVTNNAVGYGSTVAGGSSNLGSGNYSWVPGGYEASAMQYQGAWAFGYFSLAGDAQADEWVMRGVCTTASPIDLSIDGFGSPLNLRSPSVVQLLISIVGTTSPSSGNLEAWGGLRQVIIQTDGGGDYSLIGDVTTVGTDQATGQMQPPGVTVYSSGVRILSGYTLDGSTTYWVARVIGVQVIYQ